MIEEGDDRTRIDNDVHVAEETVWCAREVRISAAKAAKGRGSSADCLIPQDGPEESMSIFAARTVPETAIVCRITSAYRDF